MDARPRTHVHNVVGGSNRVLVVLYDHNRIAKVAQVEQCVEQTVVVALVQADRRLIQNVHHTDQARPNLARQADPLCFATGQRVGAAAEAQVVEANIDQEAQSVSNFLEHLLRDGGALTGQLQVGEQGVHLGNRKPSDLWKCQVSDVDVPRLDAQAGAVTTWAGLGAEVAGQLLAHHLRFGLAVTALHVGDDALEPVPPADQVTAVIGVTEVDQVVAAALENALLLF